MKATKPLIVELNRVLAGLLVAINQYFLHARMMKNWGFLALAKHEYKDSIEVMRHADELIERILFLEGLPNLQELGKLSIGEDVPEILKSDLALEFSIRDSMKGAIAFCEGSGDYVSRELLAHLLEDCEERVDFFETQIELVGKLGLPNYLQSAVGAEPEAV